MSLSQSDDDLVRIAGGQNPLGSAELIRRLKDSVEKLNTTSTKQQEEMIRLTRWIFRLTWVMVFVGIVQVGQIIVSIFGK